MPRAGLTVCFSIRNNSDFFTSQQLMNVVCMLHGSSFSTLNMIYEKNDEIGIFNSAFAI